MTTEELKALFKKHEDQYIKGTGCRDLTAFNLLNKLVPVEHDIICHAEHDEIWLSTDFASLAAVATEADVITLLQCGVLLDPRHEALRMNV